ncbi:hypothetical protein KCU62_g102, partial [Aureobasidium sp. EXF-3399]
LPVDQQLILAKREKQERADWKQGHPLTDPPKFGAAVTPAKIELTAAETSGSRVAEGFAETLDSSEEIGDWNEAGSAGVTPATIEAIAEDTPASRVAEGVVETRDRREEMMGWTEVGSCEACKARELSAGPGAIELPVETVSPPTMDDTWDDILGSLAALRELSAGPTATGAPVGTLMPATMDATADDTLGSRTAVGVAEICASSDDTIGRIEDGS